MADDDRVIPFPERDVGTMKLRELLGAIEHRYDFADDHGHPLMGRTAEVDEPA